MDKTIIIALLGGAGITILPQLIAYFLPREKTERYGVKLGRMISVLLRTKLGGAVENKLELTLLDFMNGLKKGMRKDNV